jgi:hypothetical protein
MVKATRTKDLSHCNRSGAAKGGEEERIGINKKRNVSPVFYTRQLGGDFDCLRRGWGFVTRIRIRGKQSQVAKRSGGG